MPRIRIRRTLGMGDKVFAAGALFGYRHINPGWDMEFDDGGSISSFLRELAPLGNSRADVYVDLDKARCDHPGNRAKYYAGLLGVERVIYPLPWDLPIASDGLPIICPFGAGDVPTRSLTETCIKDFAAISSGESFLLLDNNPHPEFDGQARLVNLAGKTDWKQVLVLCARAPYFVGIDAGLSYVLASMGKPGVIAYTHIRACERSISDRVVSVESCVSCAPCGDFAPPAPCQDQDYAACSRAITGELLNSALQEVM